MTTENKLNTVIDIIRTTQNYLQTARNHMGSTSKKKQKTDSVFECIP